MKSSAQQALAALKHKYQNLIRQHGSSKQALHVAAEQAKFDGKRITGLRKTLNEYVDVTVAQIKTIERLEFDLRAAHASVREGVKGFISKEDHQRLTIKHRLAESEAGYQRGQVESWKHFSIIISILSAVAGAGTVYGLVHFGIL